MQLWIYRNINLIGRVCIVKSLILSKIIHVLQSLPTPNIKFMNKIEKLCTNFIWKDKRHEVNKQTLCLPIEQAGLNMVNLKDFDNSLKITWLENCISMNQTGQSLPIIIRLISLLQLISITTKNYSRNKKSILEKCIYRL